MCASYGTPKSFSTVQADLTTGQSLSEPMIIATFFNVVNLPYKRKQRSAPLGYTALWFYCEKGMTVQNTHVNPKDAALRLPH